MKYDQIKGYSETQFRRITGVKRTTFEKMLELLKTAHTEKHRRRGRNPKLSMEERLLAALEYWREYRTYAHIAASYGVAESNIYRTIQWIEDILIKDGTFSLPGKKALLKNDVAFEVVLVDVTESPVERPKRGSENGIPARKSGTQQKRK
jgi:transposase-like protein